MLTIVTICLFAGELDAGDVLQKKKNLGRHVMYFMDRQEDEYQCVRVKLNGR